MITEVPWRLLCRIRRKVVAKGCGRGKVHSSSRLAIYTCVGQSCGDAW